MPKTLKYDDYTFRINPDPVKVRKEGCAGELVNDMIKKNPDVTGKRLSELLKPYADPKNPHFKSNLLPVTKHLDWALRPEHRQIIVTNQILEYGRQPHKTASVVKGTTRVATEIEKLLASDDVVAREMGEALVFYQDVKERQTGARRLGREPGTIKKYGFIATMESRILGGGSGYELVPREQSYEGIAVRHPHRFSEKVVQRARERIAEEQADFAPQPEGPKLDEVVAVLLMREHRTPDGVDVPSYTVEAVKVFDRDPKVKAHALREARGKCESCDAPAPFKNMRDVDYLEVHHVHSLSAGGSDTPGNTVALCPNCHRGLHHAHDRDVRVDALYALVTRLVRPVIAAAVTA
jgi:HNH endonuclease